MTIVSAIATDAELCMLADSRITWTNQTGISSIRDVCQKLFVLKKGWGLLGWAGDLCLGRDLVRAFFNRLNATDPGNPAWLRSDDTIKTFLRDCAAHHADGRLQHKPCQQRVVQLMFGWMDYGRNPFTPPIEVLSVSMPAMSIRRTGFGVDVIGSGEAILDKMRFDSFMNIMVRYQDEPNGYVKRALYSAGEAAKHLRRTNLVTVGGLFQIAVLSAKGVQMLDHFQLVPIAEPGFGTYVAMRTRAGMWLQEHRPTGLLTKIVAPFDIELRGPLAGKSTIFDPKATFSKDTPGVIPFTSPYVMDFCLYDPENIPPEIIRSWGDKPLEPLSWAQGPPPKRWRK